MRRYIPILILVLIPLIGWAGYNAPLFNWPLAFDGQTLSVANSITLRAERVAVATMTVQEISGPYAFMRESFTVSTFTDSLTFSTLSFSTPNSAMLFINGSLQEPYTDYTLFSSDTITLSQAVISGTRIQAVNIQ